MKRNLLHFLILLSLATFAGAQSTASLAGVVTDSTGALLPAATVTVHNNGTGTDRVVTSDRAGEYVVPSLPPGEYSVTVVASGFGNFSVRLLPLQVDQKASLNVKMPLASTGEIIQVEAAAPLIDAESITVGQVIDRQTVQEIPLNGRHFLDLTVLTPGGVTAPANGSLTAPSRGLGANSFVTAGNREDSNNFQVNGVNLNDMVQNQITFQPSINTTSEFKINNQTFSAEYGRSSGSVVNVSTKSGTNSFHGELFEYLRNEALDARNYFNPAGTQIAPLKRHNFGAALGGPIWRDHTFFFASYEGLRQSQGLTLNSGVLTAAQRAGVTDPVSQKLLALIPLANDSTGSRFIGIAGGPVQTDQGTIDLSHTFRGGDTVHAFYAAQKDKRTEPTLQGNTVGGFGDNRAATRQILTINETHVFTPRLVNEARLGFNRIGIAFNPNVTTDPTTLGLGTGTTGANGIPQITITGPGLNFGGPSGFPQGRTDTLGIFSDTATYTVGKHSVKFGGEFRRFLNANFSSDTGSLGFNSVANFQAGRATSFAITPTRVSNRIYVNAVGGFVQDAWKVLPTLTLELGLRYEWNGSPLDGADRLVVFDLPSTSLIRVGTNGLGHSPYKQNFNYEPRVGFAYDVFGTGKTILRGAYGYMADQPETNVVTGLNGNPPFASRVTYTNSTAVPSIPVASLYASAAAAGIGVTGVQRDLRNAYTETFNFNVQHELPFGVVTSIGYYGSVGRHLRTPLNVNQPNAAAVRPFLALSATSPISPGANISGVNISQVSSIGSSNYNAMWFTLRKAFRNGLNFNFNYNYSKSLDTGSLSGTVLQDATRPYLNYGPSDYDTANRISVNAIYALPFHGNRLIAGWQLSGISQWQTGNPLNVTTTSVFTGTSGVIHPNLLLPVQYQKTLASATTVRWLPADTCTNTITTPSCVFQAVSTGFGNLSRNALRGPGFADTDFSIEKNTSITERVKFQLRADAFDIFNHPSFGNPSTSITLTTTAASAANPTPTVAGNPSFGLISATRFPVGDLGSSRQLQIIGKIIF